MDISKTPNIKPYRDYNEHEVLNLFSANVATLNKGTFVTVLPNSGNTNVLQGGNTPATPHLGVANTILGGTPSRAFSFRTEVKWKVKPSASGEVPLGITLYDVAETNKYGEATIFRPLAEQLANDLLASGQAVPILPRGYVLYKGQTGTASAGTGITHCVSGVPVVGPYVKGTSFGRFLTGPDADGYSLLKLEL